MNAWDCNGKTEVERTSEYHASDMNVRITLYSLPSSQFIQNENFDPRYPIRLVLDV